MTREQYLYAIIEQARPMFAAVSATIPDNVRAGVGLPRSRKAIGECWRSTCSADKGREIFVSPVLVDPIRVAGTLVHELCHAALPDGVAHKAPFVRLARAMHLEGKPTATVEGEAFKGIWLPILEAIGPYPGVAFDPLQMPKTAATRMIKCQCEECGFVFRTAKKWLEAAPSMRCPRPECEGAVAIEIKE